MYTHGTSPGRTRQRAALAAAAALPLLIAVIGAAGPAQAVTASVPHGRTALADSKPAWAGSAADRGSIAGSSPVTVRVYLAGDQAGLEAAAKAASDPGSASYGAYLTPAQVQAKYGATAQQLAQVRAWLSSAGLRITASNQNYLTVQGDVASAQQAFAVQLHDYAKDGHVYRAPTSQASVPAALADAVLSVTGLSTAPSRATHQDVLPAPPAVYVNSGPFSSYYGSNPATTEPAVSGRAAPYVVKGYTGKQLRAAYGATGTGLTGAGVRVAIVDAYDSPTIASDAATYAAANGDAAYTKGQLAQVDPATWTDTAPDKCDAAGWYGEQTLDVEAVHAMAPKAGITFVAASSCNDTDLADALSKIVDNRLATIVSDSFGEPETSMDPALDAVYNHVFLRGALEGIGFYFSSGDNGDELANTGVKQTDMPASLPWVTAVGGTSLAVGKHNTYVFETGWGTLRSTLSADGKSWTGFPGVFWYGAGGGVSSRVTEPWYQRLGAVPTALSGSGSAAKRVVPDIAADADPNTGFLVGQTQTFPDGTAAYSEYRIGGTSLASPLIAGVQALAQQAQGFPIGFANPELYRRSTSSTLRDVTDHPYGPQTTLADVRVDYVNGFDASGGTSVSLRALGSDSSLVATRGYDEVTGLGSPTAAYLYSFRYGWRQGR